MFYKLRSSLGNGFERGRLPWDGVKLYDLRKGFQGSPLSPGLQSRTGYQQMIGCALGG